MLKKEDIRIRDPFILTDKENGCYYMYGTTALKNNSIESGRTFSVYKTTDLENFSEPKVVFDGEKIGFWGARDYWAPEVHKYNGSLFNFDGGHAMVFEDLSGKRKISLHSPNTAGLERPFFAEF